MSDTDTDTAGARRAARTRVDDIPVAHTPSGGWHGDWPRPVLAQCHDPIPLGAPNLRGWWRVAGFDDATDEIRQSPKLGMLQRIEQAGDRMVVTASGVIHDMRCDGTYERGVHDVMYVDYTTPIHVVATYEHGVHVLRPVDATFEVTRHRDGPYMVWSYAGLFTARCVRVADPDVMPDGAAW